MNKKNIVLAILIIGFSICLYFFSLKDQDTRKDALMQQIEEYPLIENSKTDYRGIVSNCFISKVTGKGFLIELTSGKKFTIYGAQGNTNYKKKNLADNLAQGDSIFYNHMTYEFYIYKKNGEELYFKLFNSY